MEKNIKSKITHIKDALKHKTARDIIINTVGNFLIIGFTAVYYYLMIRTLSKTDYAIVSVLFGIVFVLNNMLDFGITASLYAKLPNFGKKDYLEKVSFVKTNFTFQLIFSSIVVGIYFMFSSALDVHFFKLGVSARLYFWALLAVEAFLFQNFITNVLMATQRVVLNNVIINVANAIKSVVLITLLMTGVKSLEIMIIILGVFGPFMIALLLIMTKSKVIWEIVRAPIQKKHLHLQYSIVYFLSQQLFNLAIRLDLFLLSYYLAKDIIGEYAASQKVILVVISAIISITQVLSPQFAAVKTKHDLTSLLRRSFVYISIPILAFIGAIILPESIYIAFFQKEYVLTGLLTRLLSLSYILFAIISIIQMYFLYTVKKVNYLLYSNLLFLILIGIGCYIFIPIWGVFGPTIAFGIGFSVMMIQSLWLFKKEYDAMPVSIANHNS